MNRVSKDQRLYDALADLKRHLNTCKYCMPAIKASEPLGMCRAGMLMTLAAARGYDDVIRLRIAAHKDPAGHVIACPDPSKHGKAYALTAPALHVVAAQDVLF